MKKIKLMLCIAAAAVFPLLAQAEELPFLSRGNRVAAYIVLGIEVVLMLVALVLVWHTNSNKDGGNISDKKLIISWINLLIVGSSLFIACSETIPMPDVFFLITGFISNFIAISAIALLDAINGIRNDLRSVDDGTIAVLDSINDFREDCRKNFRAENSGGSDLQDGRKLK